MRRREGERDETVKLTIEVAYMEDRDEYGEAKQPCTGVQEDSLHIIKLFVSES